MRTRALKPIKGRYRRLRALRLANGLPFRPRSRARRR